MKKAIIIGSGIGGLCTAVRLLSKGYETIILEKEETIGGKTNCKITSDFKFDLTASIMMTPYIYSSIFKDVNKNINDYMKIRKLDHTYRVNYYDKTYYDFYYDSEKTINMLESIEKGLSAKYYNLISKSFEKYLKSKYNILDKTMISTREITNLNFVKNIIQINPLTKSYNYIGRKINNEKIRDFLIFQTMYIGVNPYTSSSIYTLIPSITQLYGISYIEGGLYSYIKGLEKLIKELGGEIRVNSEVNEILIDNKKVKGVRCDKDIIEGDIVVCNADYPYVVDKLIKEDISNNKYKKNNLKKLDYSLSTFIIYLGLKKKYKEMPVHNIYINKDFKKSIEAAFNEEIPINPSLYLYYPSSVDNTLSKENHSVLNIMLRVPNLKNKNITWNKEFIKNIRDNVMESVKNIKGLSDIESHIVYEDYLTPRDLKNNHNLYYGNAFGLSHNLMQSAYLRPHIKSNKVDGLYFINSSTHPGNGVSVVIDGTKVLCDLIDKKG